MPSRRKQIRPIKASSCQLLDLSHNKSYSLLPKLEIDFRSWDSSLLSKISSLEDEHKSVNIKLDENDEVDKKVCDLPIESETTDEYHDICKTQTTLEENLDEISKKMNKDEAKILPFQSSGGVDFFKCPLCDQSYICGRESLTIHLQEHQNKMKRDDGKHLCCLCSKELSSNSSLERHLLTHSNHRPFSCFMCDKKFTTNGNLSRHIKTSHNNNETIESSIDEVLKKHQVDVDKIPIDVSPENKLGKIKKQFKSSRKELKSSSIIKTENKLIDPSVMQPCLGMEDNIVSEPIFKTILPSNMNFFSPLLSLNINEFSFIKPNSMDKLNFLQSGPISFMTNTLPKVLPETADQFNKKETFKHLKSISLHRILATKLLLKKITLHLNRSRKIKYRAWRSNIKCGKCSTIFLRTGKIISHIRKCYVTNSNEPKYCMFKMCNRKFGSKSKYIHHIKSSHMKHYHCNRPSLSTNVEPLNLSMKSSKPKNLSAIPSGSVKNVLNMNVSNMNNFDKSELHTNFSQILKNESSDGIIDFSTNDLSWNYPKSGIPQPLTSNAQLNSFSTTNQFIHSSSFLTSSPLHLSTSFKHDWCHLNKMDFNDNLINIDALSPKSDIHSHLSNLSLRSSINPTIPSISHNGIENLSGKSSIADLRSSTPQGEHLKLKYNIGIKKKNSYKDAPKLITCPMEGCVQKFPWNSSLMRHILTHTAHKPFKCTRCTKCFSTKSNRERHMTRVHGVRINRSKFKSLQAAKACLEESSKINEEAADSENGNLIDETFLTNDKDLNITELSEEEWIMMDNNDRRAEDISNNLLKLAGQPLVEPNPVRLNNHILLDKSISPKSEYSSKLTHTNSKDRSYLDTGY